MLCASRCPRPLTVCCKDTYWHTAAYQLYLRIGQHTKVCRTVTGCLHDSCVSESHVYTFTSAVSLHAYKQIIIRLRAASPRHVREITTKFQESLARYNGLVVAQEVTRWLSTEEAQLRARDKSCGIYGRRCSTGAIFLRGLRFPLPVNYSTDCSTIIIIVYQPDLVQ
jgi:hypothetical protein